ncbi:hypothetical protein HQ576_07640, partial [bacterium]|nr:hypothetical protein [bacterium]
MGRSLLSWLFGVDRGKLAQGSGMRLKFSSPWPTWLLLVFAALAVWTVFHLYRRERGTATSLRKMTLAVVRCLLVALVVLVLFGPILAVDRSELEQAYVVVLLDDSLSMGLTDHYGDAAQRLALARAAGIVDAKAAQLTPAQQQTLDTATRADLVNRVLAHTGAPLLAKLQTQCKLRVATFAHTVRGVAPEAWQPRDGTAAAPLIVPRGDRTLLGGAMAELAESLRGHRIAAMVVLSDGRSHDSNPTTAEVARRLAMLHGDGFPVFAIGVGSEDEQTDLRVVRLLAPDTVRTDDQVVFNALVASRGFGGDVDVQLQRNGQVVESKRVTLQPTGEPMAVAIPHTPDTKGKFRFSVVVPPVPDETDRDNNTAVHDLEVKDAKTKLLLVAGQPSYFYRFLKNTLVSDASIELSAWLQSADDDFVQEGNLRITRYPQSRAELLAYHVVVLSDVDPAAFTPSQIDDLDAFVGRAGGGLIFVAGPSFSADDWQKTKLAGLLPVELGRGAGAEDLLITRSLKDPFRPRLTEQGRRHGVLRLASPLDASKP